MRTAPRLLAGICLALSAAAFASAQGENLLPNFGFEAWADAAPGILCRCDREL